MQQIKLFSGVEPELETLEQEVNHWLRESGARVVSVFGNMSPQTVAPGAAHTASSGSRRFGPSDVLLCVVHETE